MKGVMWRGWMTILLSLFVFPDTSSPGWGVVDERRTETADRVARYQTSSENLAKLLVPQTAAATWRVFCASVCLVFRFVLSLTLFIFKWFRFFSSLSLSACHIPWGETWQLLLFFLPCSLSICFFRSLFVFFLFVFFSLLYIMCMSCLLYSVYIWWYGIALSTVIRVRIYKLAKGTGMSMLSGARCL